jgi:hypothetical protein
MFLLVYKLYGDWHLFYQETHKMTPVRSAAKRVAAGGEGGRRRKRLRSRNAYIDACLEREPQTADSYADLEDWIVTKPGKQYNLYV